MPFSLNNLNEIQLDVLREVGNIGSGNAATALSFLLGNPVNIRVPEVKILDYSEVADAFGGPENMAVGLLLCMEGEVNGMFMVLMRQEFAHLTINALMQTTYDSFDSADEMAISGVKEVANIMAGAYVGALSTMANLDIFLSPPNLSIDMVGALLSVPAIHYANISDKIIFIENEFICNDEKLDNHILMIPDIESLKMILKNLGIDYE